MDASENNVSAEWGSVEDGDSKADHTEEQNSENDNNRDQTRQGTVSGVRIQQGRV